MPLTVMSFWYWMYSERQRSDTKMRSTSVFFKRGGYNVPSVPAKVNPTMPKYTAFHLVNTARGSLETVRQTLRIIHSRTCIIEHVNRDPGIMLDSAQCAFENFDFF